MSNPVATSTEDLASLEHFVVDNDDLLELEERIGRFNLFDALDIARVEIRHSNALAFLLDPAESHGQGQLFLKALLTDLLKITPQAQRPLSPIEMDGVDLRGVEIRREWQHLDLLISCRDPSFVVAIENKVDTSEHSDQLARYEASVTSGFSGKPALHVLLTVSGTEPSRLSWVPYRYADIYRVLSRVRKTSQTAIGDDVLVFLDHYLSLIGSRFMDDPKIDELCRRIYKNHRRALQLINEKVGTPSSGIIAAVEEQLGEDQRWHRFYTTASIIDFIPKEWLEWLPKQGLDVKEEPRSWLVARFEANIGRLDFYLEVRRMHDPALRKRIVAAFLVEGVKAGFKRKQKEPGDSYTRVGGKERLLEWHEDETPTEEKVRAATKKWLDELYPRMETLRTVLLAEVGK